MEGFNLKKCEAEEAKNVKPLAAQGKAGEREGGPAGGGRGRRDPTGRQDAVKKI